MTGPKDLNGQIDNFVSRLKRRQVVGSYEVAMETALILRRVISTTRYTYANRILNIVIDVGRRLIAANPRELAVGNIVRRVLKIIREVIRGEMGASGLPLSPPGTLMSPGSDEEDEDEEGTYDEEDDDDDDSSAIVTDREILNRPAISTAQSMLNMLGDARTGTEVDYNKKTHNLKPEIIQVIQEEIINDLENIYKGISDQALEHIHSNEIIMTIGRSRTVEAFLIKAAQKRKFLVFVAETSPTYQGHSMATSLSAAGINTTVITDSAIFAVMSRVNKVIVSAHAVLANGGLVAVSGTELLAAAAKHHAIPVIVCTALYKLSFSYPYDEDALNVYRAPDEVLGFDEGSLIDKVTVTNPYYNYVPPEMVNMFIHNLGSSPPSYIYRLINDNYDLEDAVL